MSDEREPPKDPEEESDGAHTESAPLLLARKRKSQLADAPKKAVEALRGMTVAPPPPRRRQPGVPNVRGALPIVAGTRLGAFGLLVASLLVFVAIFADVIASDLPLICKVHGKTWLLPAVTHPAELVVMGRPRLVAEAEWKIDTPIAHGAMSRVELEKIDVARPDGSKMRVAVAPAPLVGPLSPGHLLGTDREGRDVLARMVHGTRSYLVFALVAVFAANVLGAVFGGVAGLFGGATDMVVGRVIETVSAFPPLVLVLGVQAAVPRPTLATLFLAIAVTRWPQIARLVRGEVLLASTREYALAARALGASPLRVLRRHIAPNIRGPLIISATVGVSAVVLTEASLDFLRIGVPGGAASWGETMSEFRDAPLAWWLLAFPGALLFVTVIGLNLVGEAFRDALDPRAH